MVLTAVFLLYTLYYVENKISSEYFILSQSIIHLYQGQGDCLIFKRVKL